MTLNSRWAISEAQMEVLRPRVYKLLRHCQNTTSAYCTSHGITLLDGNSAAGSLNLLLAVALVASLVEETGRELNLKLSTAEVQDSASTIFNWMLDLHMNGPPETAGNSTLH